jgi:hypothetical protein
VKPTKSDGDLLDEMACIGPALDEGEIRECLRLANEVFCGRRLSILDRAWCEVTLTKHRRPTAASGDENRAERGPEPEGREGGARG